jgi:hypothetical protein
MKDHLHLPAVDTRDFGRQSQHRRHSEGYYPEGEEEEAVGERAGSLRRAGPTPEDRLSGGKTRALLTVF